MEAWVLESFEPICSCVVLVDSASAERLSWIWVVCGASSIELMTLGWKRLAVGTIFLGLERFPSRQLRSWRKAWRRSPSSSRWGWTTTRSARTYPRSFRRSWYGQSRRLPRLKRGRHSSASWKKRIGKHRARPQLWSRLQLKRTELGKVSDDPAELQTESEEMQVQVGKSTCCKPQLQSVTFPWRSIASVSSVSSGEVRNLVDQALDLTQQASQRHGELREAGCKTQEEPLGSGTHDDQDQGLVAPVTPLSLVGAVSVLGPPGLASGSGTQQRF